MRDLPLEHLARARRVARVALGSPHHFERETHRRQRIAEFVREDAEKLVLTPIDETQRLGVDAQMLGLARIGHVVHGQEQQPGARRDRDGTCVEDQRPKPS